MRNGVRRSSWTALALFWIAATIGSTSGAAQVQQALGSIGGRVVLEESGSPLPGATVLALLIDRSPQSRGMKPMGRAYADRQGAYTIGNLRAGEYVLCARAYGSDLLASCEWDTTPEVIRLTAGQAVTTADRAIARGKRVEVEVKDPGGVLDGNEVKGRGVHLMVGVWANKRFHRAQVVAKTRQQRTYAVVIPFGRPVGLEVRGAKLDLADDKGKAKRDDDAPEEIVEARSADRSARKVAVQVKGVKP